MSYLEMPVAAIKEGQAREKEGRKYRMDTATFLMSDGDSFKLDFNAFNIQLRKGDIAVFGIRTYTNDKGYTNVSLSIASSRPASVQTAIK